MRDKIIQGYIIFSLATKSQLEIQHEKFIRLICGHVRPTETKRMMIE